MASDSNTNTASLTDANEIPHARQVLVMALVTLAEQRKAGPRRLSAAERLAAAAS